MPRENPFYYNLPTRSEDFLGRWPLVDEIVADLCRARPDSWAVIGGRRFGKSSVLKAVETRLANRLTDCDAGDWLVFPLLVDLKRCKPTSEQHIYVCILRYLYRALQRSRALNCDFASTNLHAIITQDHDSLSFFQFENVLEDLVRRMQSPFRLVLLLDEVESMTNFDWSETLFNQLRALIYDGLLADVVKLVLTGSANVIRARHAGSPLLNAVKIEHLDSFAETDLQTLIARGGEMPGQAAAAVRAQSGGHPFIAQYLLHHLWDDGLARATPAQVEQVARQMRQKRAADLQGWWEAVGDSGQWAYAVLAVAQDWLDERALLAQVQNTDQHLGQGLSALCYHGLVIRDESRQCYRVVGNLFLDWFVLNGAERLAESKTQPPGAQVIIEHLEQHVGSLTTIGGDVRGPVASGKFEGATAVGGGEAVDMREAQGALYKPSSPVTQYFADQVTVITGKTALPVPTSPPPPPHFVDRETELEKLATRLTTDEPTAATALQGMGGSGKSALAKKLAHALADYFPGGVLWTSLGMQPDQFHILESWALAAGGDVRVHTDLLNRAAAVRAILASRGKMLAVLDDVWEYECPQLLMRHALPTSATVVITTRDADLGKRLRCQIERIDTLPKADALALLEKLLGPLGAYEAAAQEIARLADYVPLALELAAGLADDSADLPDVARRLKEKPALGMLTMGAGEQRRESIEACLSLSYAALPAEMQRRFRALGVFAASPFDTAAAAAVWGLGVDEAALEKASQSLRFLARRSLLSRQEGRLYSQHSLLRAYALALLERKGEVEAIARRHAAHYLALVQEGDWRAIEATFRQVRHGWEAIKIHAPEQVTNYLLALVPFLRSSGRWNDFVEWAKYVLEQAPQAQDAETNGRLLNEMGYVYWLWGRCEDALNCLRPALNLCREANDRRGEGLSLNLIGLVHRVEGRLDEAMSYFRDSLAIRQEIGDREGEGFCLQNIGLVHRLAGRYTEALDFLQRGLAVFGQDSHTEGQSLCTANIGRVYRTMGQYDQALHYMQRGLTLAREVGDRTAEGETLDTIGDIYRFRGQYQRALEFYQQSLEVQQEIDSPVGQAYAIGDSGDVFFAQGEYDRAMKHYQQALELWRLVSDRKREASSLNAIGCVHWVQDENEQAMDFLQRSLALCQEVGDRTGEGRALNHIGGVYLADDDFDRALDLFRQALAIACETTVRPGEGVALNNIGLAHAGRGEYEIALDDLQRSLSIAQELGERAAEGTVWWNMSNLYRRMGQLEEAEKAQTRASAISDQLGCAYGDGVRRWFE